MGVSDREVNPAESEAVTHVVPEAPVVRAEHAENTLTRLVEQQAAKVPSAWFLLAAFASMGVSLTAELRGNARVSRFVGQWVSPLLVMGVYNKLVKTIGSR